jgi:lantibiotic modifying enzyme
VCNGAAGILAARLASLPAIPELASSCEVALSACTRCRTCEVDHVCCGNFGRIEAECLAADVLRRPWLREAAKVKAAALLEDGEANGGFSLFAPSPEICHPSLRTGTAGIGYVLLRLADPSLPTLLL